MLRSKPEGHNDDLTAPLALVKQGLAVECELIDEHGGKGLRYSATHPSEAVTKGQGARS